MPRDGEPRTAHGEVRETAPRVLVDPALCIGSGICLATAPRHFESGDDNRSRARSDAPEADESAESAAALCPVEAIGLVASGSRAPRPGPPAPGVQGLVRPPGE
ncbi:MAG TPA: ferredoxin [Streptomyces sp.]|nr:ferredoxin [Streptomyces sp.]